jgi:predicted flavoprotein YhiN
MTLNQLDDKTCKQLESFLKDIRLPIKGVRDFDYCQVSAGGVPVTQVDPSTMESMKVKGLYLTGETLDVVGPCGGYNLQFAFSSGALAGMAAARSV